MSTRNQQHKHLTRLRPGRLYAPHGTDHALYLLRCLFTDGPAAREAAGVIVSLAMFAVGVVGLIVVFGPELAR